MKKWMCACFGRPKKTEQDAPEGEDGEEEEEEDVGHTVADAMNREESEADALSPEGGHGADDGVLNSAPDAGNTAS